MFSSTGYFIAGLSVLVSVSSAVPYSRGYYRIPYATGTTVRISRDASDHSPIGRIDMYGRRGSAYKIVAAASGYIRHIEDSFTGKSTGASCYNNYVWIEHPNGEWTKYSHVAKNSASGKAGLSVGQWVNMGTYLGDEDDVGCASGDHLHFEVAVPPAVDPFTIVGGFVNDNKESKRNRIPRVCGIPGGIYKTGKEYTASWQPYNYAPGHAEIARHGLPIEYYQCQYNQMRDGGYEPVWLDFFNSRGRAYVNVIGRRRTVIGYGFHGFTSQQYQSVYDRYKRLKYQPITVDSYLYLGEVRYAGYFKKISGPLFAGYHGATQGTHQSKFNSWIKLGYLPTSLSVVSVNGERRYTAIYKKQSQGSVLVRSTLTTAQYQKAFDDNAKAGRRVAYLNGYNHKGKAYIVAIFNSVTPGGGKYRHGLSSSQYQAEYNSARSAGLLTRIVTGYEESGTRYAAGWR